MTADLRALPKAELHLHLEGAIRTETAVELAGRYGLPMPDSGEFPDLTAFTVAYERARDLIGSLDDLRRVAHELVEDAHAQGIVWTEVHLFPVTYAGRLGRTEAVLEAVLDGLATGSAAVRGESAAAVILGVNRSLPTAAAMASLDLAVSYHGHGVVGLGLAGDEANHPAARFTEVFARARALGVPALPHAGEARGADSVRVCVEALGAQRINHGIRAVEDARLLDFLAEREICLDVCPTSNVALNVVGSWEEHPLRTLLAAGVPVSLNSDVPLFVGSSALGEYERARQFLSLDDDGLARIAASSLSHSFCPPDRLQRFQPRIEDWAVAG